MTVDFLLNEIVLPLHRMVKYLAQIKICGVNEDIASIKQDDVPKHKYQSLLYNILKILMLLD